MCHVSFLIIPETYTQIKLKKIKCKGLISYDYLEYDLHILKICVILVKFQCYPFYSALLLVVINIYEPIFYGLQYLRQETSVIYGLDFTLLP